MKLYEQCMNHMTSWCSLSKSENSHFSRQTHATTADIKKKQWKEKDYYT